MDNNGNANMSKNQAIIFKGRTQQYLVNNIVVFTGLTPFKYTLTIISIAFSSRFVKDYFCSSDVLASLAAAFRSSIDGMRSALIPAISQLFSAAYTSNLL